ncbi:nuclease-related domain-containing protein [Nesterenkonia rhizosphaerae]|uniref:NERD domain-containing protein n=1 Tax=Nesterenkonia rhizosphaerae TaxID=1348272 RepID=A0ABP9G0L2_9MICC
MSTGVYGRPGGSLGTKYGSTGEHGAGGERRTAAVLAKYSHDAAIIHDIIVPGLSANLDHLIVAGDSILVLDSKVWRDGFYHCLLGSTLRRGLTPVDHDRREGLGRMCRMLAEHVDAPVTPKLVVWPSSAKQQVMIHPSLGRQTIPIFGARHIPELVEDHIRRHDTPNPRLVSELKDLMY